MNILFVDDLNVFKPHFGAEQRSNLLLRACCRIAQVDVVLFNKYNVTPDIENCKIVYENIIEYNYTIWDHIKMHVSLNYECFEVVNPKMQTIISDLVSAKRYDYIVARYIPNAIRYGLMKYADRLVIDIDDNPIIKLLIQLKSLDTSKLKGKACQLFHQYKLPLYHKAYAHIIEKIKIPFVSNIEDIVINEYKCVHLPNVPFTEPDVDYCDFATTSKRVIWVGLIDYPPNSLGLEHFFEFIYPKVLSKLPDFEIIIAGKYDNYDVSKWQQLQGVSVKGFVEDLEAEYLSARAAIVPCYSGAGTNIKVLEAMRMKRPCITSEYGARGYNKYFNKNEDYLVCNNDEEFAASIIDMLENKDKNRSISKNGYDKVKKYFSQEGFYKIVESCLKYQS